MKNRLNVFPEIPDFSSSKFLEILLQISRKSSKCLKNIWLQLKHKKIACHLKWQHKFTQISGVMFLYRVQQNSKQFHINSPLFTVPLRLQED